MCEIESNELISKGELIEKLIKQGYPTSEERHHADFYYVLKVKVVNDACDIKEIGATWLNSQNGNDTYSPHSPKVLNFEDIYNNR